MKLLHFPPSYSINLSTLATSDHIPYFTAHKVLTEMQISPSPLSPVAFFDSITLASKKHQKTQQDTKSSESPRFNLIFCLWKTFFIRWRKSSQSILSSLKSTHFTFLISQICWRSTRLHSEENMKFPSLHSKIRNIFLVNLQQHSMCSVSRGHVTWKLGKANSVLSLTFKVLLFSQNE